MSTAKKDEQPEEYDVTGQHQEKSGAVGGNAHDMEARSSAADSSTRRGITTRWGADRRDQPRTGVTVVEPRQVETGQGFRGPEDKAGPSRQGCATAPQWSAHPRRECGLELTQVKEFDRSAKDLGAV